MVSLTDRVSQQAGIGGLSPPIALTNPQPFSQPSSDRGLTDYIIKNDQIVLLSP